MANSKLFFTIGPSHSGKSTFAREWMKYNHDSARVVVTTDNIRLALTGQRYNKHSETQVFAMKHVMIKTLLLEGYDVLVCGTHTTKESIRRILEINMDAVPLVFDTPLEVCIERTKLTGHLELPPVITRHYNQLQELKSQGIEKVIEEIKADIAERWNQNV